MRKNWQAMHVLYFNNADKINLVKVVFFKIAFHCDKTSIHTTFKLTRDRSGAKGRTGERRPQTSKTKQQQKSMESQTHTTDLILAICSEIE